jgi:hypothetical protein
VLETPQARDAVRARWQVVQGLDEGILGMREGGRRHLVVPPKLGYGSQGVPGHVPPDSVIHIEVSYAPGYTYRGDSKLGCTH